MPERIMPGLGLRAFYDPGQRNWGTSLSEDLRRLSALVQPRATSRTAALPATGTAGQIAIVPAAASANANALALWDQSPAGAAAWVYLPPQEGWQVWVTDEARFVRFAAGVWLEVPRPGVVQLRTRWSDSGRWVRLIVTDEGSGFAEHILQRAFEPYVTTKTKGTGLGLAVVKKIMDEHGGRIDLSNRMSEGRLVGAQVSLSFAVAN